MIPSIQNRAVNPPGWFPLAVLHPDAWSQPVRDHRDLLVPARRTWMPSELDVGNACSAGSFDAWLVGTKQAGGECFLLHAFSGEVLPCFSFLPVSRRPHPRPRWPNR